jgi:hypothetical protein
MFEDLHGPKQTVPSAERGASMAHSFDELKKKTVADLREIAKGLGENEHVQGFSQMNKEHLLVALCKALSIDTRGYHVAADFDKAGIKKKLRGLKKQRDELVGKGDHAKLRIVRRKMHGLKRAIRKNLVP